MSVSAQLKCKAHNRGDRNTLQCICAVSDGKMHATYDVGMLVGCPVGLETKSKQGVSEKTREVSTLRSSNLSWFRRQRILGNFFAASSP